MTDPGSRALPKLIRRVKGVGNVLECPEIRMGFSVLQASSHRTYKSNSRNRREVKPLSTGLSLCRKEEVRRLDGIHHSAPRPGLSS